MRHHFTAWLVDDPSCLDQAHMDITVLEDTVTGYSDDGQTPVWSTAAGSPTRFHALTGVDAREGDVADGQRQAEELLREAGWVPAGAWEANATGAIVTVEPARQDV